MNSGDHRGADFVLHQFSTPHGSASTGSTYQDVAALDISGGGSVTRWRYAVGVCREGEETSASMGMPDEEGGDGQSNRLEALRWGREAEGRNRVVYRAVEEEESVMLGADVDSY